MMESIPQIEDTLVTLIQQRLEESDRPMADVIGFKADISWHAIDSELGLGLLRRPDRGDEPR